MTKAGIENCSTIVLPAVVSLLASAKRLFVTEIETAAAMTAGLILNLCFVASITTRMNAPAMIDRALLIAMAFQPHFLKKSPPVAKSTADRKTKTVPLRNFRRLRVLFCLTA